MKIMRPAETINTLSISKSTLWRWIGEGNFPRPIKLGNKAVGWDQETIQEWINDKAERGDKK